MGKVTLTLVNATLSTLTAEWTHVGGDDLSQFLITYHEVTEELNGNEPTMVTIRNLKFPEIVP